MNRRMTATTAPMTRSATAPMLVLPVLLLLGGCANEVRVDGTYEEVWQRTQEAMKTARFDVADTAARYERIERDRAKGTIKYVWSDGDFFDSRVVTLTITPTEETPGAACPALERSIQIDAWTWGFFGWMQVADGTATQRVHDALMAEFAHDRVDSAPLGPSSEPRAPSIGAAGQ
jgi:hypothetical protein